MILLHNEFININHEVFVILHFVYSNKHLQKTIMGFLCTINRIL